VSEEPPAYQGSAGGVTWTGVRVPQSLLDELREGPLIERMYDLTLRDQYIAELQAMASTDMATDVITPLLESEAVVLSRPRPPPKWHSYAHLPSWAGERPSGCVGRNL
jgi:hypothetical protein